MAPDEFDPRTLLNPDRLVEGFIVTSDGRLFRRVDPTKQQHEPDDLVAIGPTLPELYCVIYRTGGTVNFKWHRTLALTRGETMGVLHSIELLGYVCHLEEFFGSIAAGLPQVFDPEFPSITEWH